MQNYNTKSSENESCFHIPQLQCSLYFSMSDQHFWPYSFTHSAVNREQKWCFSIKQISLLHPLIPSWEKPTKAHFLQWQWTRVRAMGYQIKDKCVIISTLTCMHSRAILLKKELTNPLLQFIRKVHLSSVNEGKLLLKLQLFRRLYGRNSILRLSPAVGAPKDHQKVMKGSLG